MKEYIKNIVSKGNAVTEAHTKRTPSRTVSDGLIMGNGDIGAVICTETNGFSFLIGKNDFWRLPYVGENEEQRYDRLVNHQNMRRTGARILPVGHLMLTSDEMDGKNFKAVQSIYEAVTDIQVFFSKGLLTLRSWICADENALVIEINNDTKNKIGINFSLMPGMYKNSSEQPYEDGCTENSVWFQYGANIGNADGGRYVAAVCSANVKTRYYPENYTGKGGSFELLPGAEAKIILTVLSNLDTKNPLPSAEELNKKCFKEYDNLWQKHIAWWEEYWSKSWVETGNDTLDKFYYFSLYALGSAIRNGKVTPAMYGPWTTDDMALWSGAYTMNYNFQSPFFCLYSSNRQEIAEAYIDTVLEMIPVGELFAKENTKHRGILLPVEMGPWGTVCSTVFFHQKTNASYAAVNLFMHYFSTLDREIGIKAYEFIKKCVLFWEDDLVYENGVYNIVGDAAHEEYFEEGEKNNVHALGLVKMLFDGIIKMSELLGIDENERERWREINEKLPRFPTFIRNGQKVFRYNEDNYAWRDLNGTHIKFIYPFGCVNLDSDEELIEIARNTVNQKSYLFHNTNAFCEYTAMRARVNCDSKLTYDHLVENCKKYALPNNYFFIDGEGIENFNAVPGGINEMMLQSCGGTIRVFPSWPEAVNARFYKLRAYGAFIVSSQVCDNEIMYIDIFSEKGSKLNIDIPWESAELYLNEKKAGLLTKGINAIDTQCGDFIKIRKNSNIIF